MALSNRNRDLGPMPESNILHLRDLAAQDLARRDSPKITVVPVDVAKKEAECIMVAFSASGADVLKRPEIREKLAWRDENGFTVAGMLVNSRRRDIQMALAADPEALEIKNSSGTKLAVLLMFSGDNAVRDKVEETEKAARA